MSTATQAHPFTPTRPALWTGRFLSGFALVFLTFDAVAKLLQLAPVMAGAVELGYPAHTMFPIGAILLACVVLYAIPSTSLIGALFLTGYLGGAIATHVRVENPLFTHTLFPIYVALFLWGGLYLRDRRVRLALTPRG